jgi:signal transduction histidine kinase/CheY-like chemotaxis protein
MTDRSLPNNPGSGWNRWTISLVAVTALLVVAFTVLAIIGYDHVMDLTTAKDDTSWIISQVSYEHERLLLAAETEASQADLRLRGDIYLSRVSLLQNAPSFSDLRQVASPESLIKLYQSAEITDALINKAISEDGRRMLLERLRADSGSIRQEINQLSRLNYDIIVKDLASHAHDILRYIVAFGALLFVVIGLSVSGVVISRRNIQLEAQRNSANDASRLKSQFLSNMSHEIRTPLNGILGTLQLIEHDTLSRENKESIDIIGRSSRSLLGIVNNILDVSKIEAGESVISLQLFDTRILVADVLSHSAGLTRDKDIDLLVRFDQSLPTYMYSDRLKLEQILNNLLSNAAKFTEAGSIALEVRRSNAPSSREQDLGSIQFVVSDTGIGISKEDQARLFEPFKQVDSSLTRRYKGTGLGLSIVRNLVEKLGGEVELQSKPGVGTSITVEIPGALAGGSARDEDSGKESASSAPEIVLLGEYSTIFRASLSLIQLGKRVKTITTPKEAESFLKSPPSSLRAVVADRRFGEDAIAWINHIADVNGLSKDLPIIIVRGIKAYPPRSTDLAVFEIEGRFNRSAFFDVLQEAVPSLGIQPSDTMPRIGQLNDGMAAIIEGTRVLVVDDNAINRRVLVRLLRNAGVRDVEPVTGAIEALKRLEQERFDLVFMDLQMPGIDGYMAARMIREKGYGDIKIFACSAHAFESDIQRSLDEGLDGHLTKPVEAGQLMALLKDAVQPQGKAQRSAPT